MKKTIQQTKAEILSYLLDRDIITDISDEQQDARKLLSEISQLLPFETFFGKNFRIKRDHLLFKQNGTWLEIGLNKSGELVILLDTSEKQSDVRARMSIFTHGLPTSSGYFLGMSSYELKTLLEHLFSIYAD